LNNAEANEEWGEITPVSIDRNSEYHNRNSRGLNSGYPGQCYTGDRSWFYDGRLPADILEGPPPPFSDCCLPGGLVLGGSAIIPGGLVLGGSASVPVGLVVGGSAIIPGGNPCPYCRGGVGPSRYQVVASGGTGDFAAANGTWILTGYQQCFYQFVTPESDNWFVGSFSPTVTVATWFHSSSAELGWHAPNGWDCYSPVQAWTPNVVIGIGTVPTLIVTPLA
jgi:hypothetical protein